MPCPFDPHRLVNANDPQNWLPARRIGLSCDLSCGLLGLNPISLEFRPAILLRTASHNPIDDFKHLRFQPLLLHELLQGKGLIMLGPFRET
jgi:hypothetical protein